jgi:hypothetical protein
MSEAQQQEEPYVVSIEDLIAASTEKDFVSSDKIFSELMQGKIDAAVEQEKIRMAGQVYNGLEPEEMELDADDDQLELDLEDEEEQTEMSFDPPEDELET